MKIGIDLDDILGDFTPRMLEFDRDVYGSKYDVNSFEEKGAHSLSELLSKNLSEFLIKLNGYYQSKYFTEMPPLPGAYEAMQKLKSDGHDLTVITSRPAYVKGETEKWIEKNFSGIFDNIFMADKSLGSDGPDKATVCKSLGISLIVDDFLMFANECAEKDIEVFLFDTPWNQTAKLHPKITRVKNWDEITESINLKSIWKSSAINSF